MGKEVRRLTVVLDASTKALRKGLDQAKTKLGSFNKRIKTTGRALGGMTKAFAAVGTAAIAAATIVIKAASTQRKAEESLQQALENSGQAADGVAKKLREEAAALQEVSLIGDETTIAMQAVAIGLGVQADKATEMVVAAQNMGKAIGIDANTALRGLAQSLDGNIGLLGRYLPSLRGMTEEQLKSGEAISIVAKKFNGFIQLEVDDVAGRAQQAWNAFGDVLETVGKSLNESAALQRGLKSLTKKLSNIASDPAAILAPLLGVVDASLAIVGAFLTAVGIIQLAMGKLIALLVNTVLLPARGAAAIMGTIVVGLKAVASLIGATGLASVLGSVADELEANVRFGSAFTANVLKWGETAFSATSAIEGYRSELLNMSKAAVAAGQETTDALDAVAKKSRELSATPVSVPFVAPPTPEFVGPPAPEPFVGPPKPLVGDPILGDPKANASFIDSLDTAAVSFAESVASAFVSMDLGTIVSSGITSAVEIAGDALDSGTKKLLGAIAPIAGGLFNMLASFDPAEFSAQIEGLADSFSRALENIGPFVATVFDNLDEIITALITGIAGGIISLIANIPNMIGALVNALFDFFGQIPNRVGAMFKNIADQTANVFKGLIGSMGSKIRTFLDRFFVEGFRGLVDKLKSFFSDVVGDAGNKFVTFMKSMAEKFVNFLIGGLNKGIDAINKILPGFAEINKIPKVSFAQGGDVAGARGAGDIVPAMLTPGEHVLTVGQNNKFDRLIAMLEQGGGIGGGNQLTVVVDGGSSPGESADMVEARLRQLEQEGVIDNIFRGER